MDMFELNEKSDRDILILVAQGYLRMEKDLYGNGQPGKLAELSKSIKALEIWKWLLAGGLFVIGSAPFAALVGRAFGLTK